jgi:VCBS repeat-containing protein
VQENQSLTVAAPGVLSGDTDPNNLSLTAVLVSGPAHGTLTPDANHDGGFIYTPTTGFYGADSFTYEAADGVATSTPATVTITVTEVNQAPTVTAPATASVDESATLVFSTANGNAITLTDASAAGNSDSLTLAVSHGTLTLASITGLIFSGAPNGSARFTVTGTLASLNAALNGLVYTPNPNYSGADSLSLSLKDSHDGLTGSASVSLAVKALPSIAAPTSASLIENTSLAFSSTNGNAITLIDAAALGFLDSLTLRVSHGTLTLASTTGLIFAGAPNGSAGFTITGTLANLNAALNGLVYTPNPNYSGADSLSLSLKDSHDGLTGSASVSLAVKALPKITAPSSAWLNENASLTFSWADANPIALTDADATSRSTDSLTLRVSHGTLTLASTTGLIFAGAPNGSAGFTITGTLANLNAALNGLVYTPNPNYSGADSLSLSLKDSHDGLTGSASVALTVNAPPSIAAPTSASLIENTSLAFSSTNGNAITLIDAAALGFLDSLTLRVSHGTLKVGSTTGLIFAGAPNGSAGFTITGTLAALDAALNGLVYTPTPGYAGSDSLLLSLRDLRDGLSGFSSVSLTINAPPSQPTVTLETPMLTSVPGEPVPLIILVSNTNPAAQSAAFGLEISFGDGTVKTVTAMSPLLVNHVYAQTGEFTVSVAVTDEFGHTSSAASAVIRVVPVAVETSPFGNGQTALFVGGTSGNDTVDFTASGKSGIAVTLNGVSEGVYSPTGPLIVFGQGGKDVVDEGSGVKNSVYLLESPTAENVETDLDNEALQWAGLTAAVEILNT